jgi:uncharacterized protein YndB with AHSA1/START domain
MELKFQVQAKIQKPVAEVFDAVYNPKKLSGYFTTGGASGPLKEGTTVTWEFADYPGAFPVYVKKAIENELIVFEWEAAERGYNTRVEMKFESLGPDSTLVKISESGWRESKKGLESSYDNCGGWMQMACCLKAFLEYGINLRKGFV